MLFAILLSATLLQLVACDLKEVDEGKYKESMDAVSEAFKSADPQARLKAVVKKFSDEFTKFSAGAASLLKIEDEAKAASAAAKLLKSLSQIKESLTAISVKPTPLEEVIANVYGYIVGKCFTTPEALKSDELTSKYICNENSAVLKKCVTELNPQKKEELAAVWSYYDSKGIRKGARSLCQIDTKTNNPGTNFFTKTLREWPSSSQADVVARGSTNPF